MGINFEERAIQEGVSIEELKQWILKSKKPIQKFFNTSGHSYRNGNFKEQLPFMSDEEKISALAHDGMLIKRPLLVDDHIVLVGYNESEYNEIGENMEKNSESLEMYLETMYLLEITHGKIRSVDIASKLCVSKPSVNKAVNILKEQGYLTQEAYGNIHLTAEGRAVAMKIYDRHTVLTRFLEEKLHISHDNAENDACKMEHILSDETFEKIKDSLK